MADGAGIDRHPEANTTGSRASKATVHTITGFFTSETPLLFLSFSRLVKASAFKIIPLHLYDRLYHKAN